jgi:hypothetical protein
VCRVNMTAIRAEGPVIYDVCFRAPHADALLPSVRVPSQASGGVYVAHGLKTKGQAGIRIFKVRY